MLKKIIPVMVLIVILPPVLNALESKKTQIPQAAVAAADSFVIKLHKDNPEALYNELDSDIKSTATAQEIKAALQKIQDAIVDQKCEPSYTKISPENHVYLFAYDVKIKNFLCELTIIVKQKGDAYTVGGFHLMDKPRRLFDFTNASLSHYIISTLFIACIVSQLAAFIFFIVRKNLGNKKWLYVLSSIVGFPFGFSLNWTTEAWIYHFGFNIPAVGVSSPVQYPGFWTVTVYLPLGFAFMIRELMKNFRRT